MQEMQHALATGLEHVSWDDIALLASIREFASLRQAARAFSVNASTLVRRVEKLEAALGTTILDRLPQGIQLNAAGLAVAEVAREMQRSFLRLQDVAQLDRSLEGRVKVAVTEGLGAFWLAPRLPAFAAANPKLLVEMEASMDLRNLLRNEADVAIQLKRPETPDVVASRLCHLHVHPFAALAYVEKHGLPSIDDRRARHRLVLQESEQLANAVIFDFLGRHRLEHEVAFVTNSSLAHLYAIEKGLGIGGLPTFAMAMGARLVPLDVGFHHSTEVWLSYRPAMRKVRRVSLVIDWLRQVFDPKRYPWFAPDFLHPAEVLRIVNTAMERRDIFDSKSIKDFIAGGADLATADFRRPRGRPRAVTSRQAASDA
jgi:DNA-binding transcriptional LysR family regulator